jgi:hypothetical protein
MEQELNLQWESMFGNVKKGGEEMKEKLTGSDEAVVAATVVLEIANAAISR